MGAGRERRHRPRDVVGEPPQSIVKYRASRGAAAPKYYTTIYLALLTIYCTLQSAVDVT